MRGIRETIAVIALAALVLTGAAYAQQNGGAEDQASGLSVVVDAKFDTVTYVINGESAVERVKDGDLPAQVPAADANGTAISQWRDENGNPVDPAKETINGDRTFTAVTAAGGAALKTGGHVLYISGSSDGKFYPNRTMTRAEAAQMIYKLVTVQASGTAPAFTDVTADKWYYGAVMSLAGAGIMKGYDDGSFRPGRAITRAEFVVLLESVCPAGTGESYFTDVGTNYWAYSQISAAAAKGWIKGYADGSFRPDAGITRAQAAAVINRMLGRAADHSVIDNNVIFSYYDIAPGDWYYGDVLEASLEHECSYQNGAETWTSYKSTVGALPRGLYSYGQDLYYIGADGAPVKDTTVDGFTFDSTGRYTSGSAELDGYVKAALAGVTKSSMTQLQKLRAAYNYTRDSFSYLRRDYYTRGYTGWTMKNALVMFQTHQGNCYCYASVFYYLARQLGYNDTAISGVVGTNSRPHGWVEIKFNGVVNIFDTELEMAYKVKGVHYNFFMMPYANVPWPYVK
jgi:hypothetical protein